ncbi:MAG: VWA domain-containing protein [Candidatus Omnitrophota bacterium]
MLRLASPWMFILCFIIPVMVYFFRKKKYSIQSSFRFSDQGFVKGINKSFRIRLSEKLIYLRSFALFLVVIALARPQTAIEETKVYVEGVDIVLAVDTSGSMNAMDFEIGGKRVNRLEVVKDVVKDFIEKRPNDRIGMISFASLAYTICPLTLDHEWLEKNLGRVQLGMIQDGTAIGAALSASLNRVKDTESKEKIIILLTDGRNNAGRISPETAAEAAKALGVRVYTIGAGTKGTAPFPVQDMFGNVGLRQVKIEIDEDLLKKIADETGGEYFRATDTESLKQIYKRIDDLEKTPMEETGYNIYRELFGYFLIPGLFLLILEIILSNTVLRRIP